jgi:hypothetical protein
MSDRTFVPDLAPVPILVREVLPWVLFGGAPTARALFRRRGRGSYLYYPRHVCA